MDTEWASLRYNYGGGGKEESNKAISALSRLLSLPNGPSQLSHFGVGH